MTAARLIPDLRASIAVFLVALPLALGVAVASGFPPIAGVLTSIIGGLVVGFLSGAPLQVSGAAAGLSVIMLDGVQRFGLAAVGIATLFAGLLQIVAGFLKGGRLVRSIARPVIQGLLVGIGALIVLGQARASLAAAPTTTVAAISVVVMLAWPRLATGRWRNLPAPLVAVVAASTAAWGLGASVPTIQLPESLALAWPTPATLLAAFGDPALLAFAAQLAFVASAESLLSAAAVDKLVEERHPGDSQLRTCYDRELVAQGLGNTLCGALGALPMTGVIVRSSANVMAGARSRASAVLHGLWMLLAILIFPVALEALPLAALAGILIVVGAKLVGEGDFRHLYRTSRYDLAVVAATAGVIVGIDLFAGIVLGLALSALKRTSLLEARLASAPSRR